MKLTIEIGEDTLALFRSTCFLRTFRTVEEMLSSYETACDVGDGPDEPEEISNAQLEICDVMHHVENVRHKIVEASRQ